MSAKQLEIAMTVVCVKRDDGWRLRFEFDNGLAVEQNTAPAPFATQAEAQAALNSYIKQACPERQDAAAVASSADT